MNKIYEVHGSMLAPKVLRGKEHWMRLSSPLARLRIADDRLVLEGRGPWRFLAPRWEVATSDVVVSAFDAGILLRSHDQHGPPREFYTSRRQELVTRLSKAGARIETSSLPRRHPSTKLSRRMGGILMVVAVTLSALVLRLPPLTFFAVAIGGSVVWSLVAAFLRRRRL